MRCAIYARFSSDLQDARSITDQVALARQRAEREGWTVVEVYSDAAISGAGMHNRPGLLDMMVAAKARQFDIVLVESLDRLSRDLEDIAGLHKRLSAWDVKIVTLADGEVSTMHVGLKGLFAKLFLEDLAQKTRRGQIGRVKAGRIPGGLCYGYDIVRTEGDRGRRVINPEEAAIVRRIFAEYTSGASPRSIAARLNAEGVPPPRGRYWNSSTLNGSRQRANGILNNRLYIGELVYNRQRFIKDPETGKRVSRLNPPSEWIVQEVPELAIVDRDVFEEAQRLRAASSTGPLHRTRRPKHLLSGLVQCGSCGQAMIIVNRGRLACSGRINKGICDMRRTIHHKEIEARVLDALRNHLLAPDVVAAVIEEYRVERERLRAERARAFRNIERELAVIDGKIARLVAAIEQADDGGRALVERLTALEAERKAILARAPAPIPDEKLALHPQIADLYRREVMEIQRALESDGDVKRDVLTRVRNLIREVTVYATPPGTPLELRLSGDLAVMIDWGTKEELRHDISGCGGRI